MRDYSVELMNIQSGINHLKGLISRSLPSATSGPTVDFLCDMFDRPDNGVLTGYWADTTGSWTIRNNRAIYQGTEGAFSSPTFTVTSIGSLRSSGGNTAFTYNNATKALLQPGMQGGQRANLYAAKMSTTDFQVKVTFDVPAVVVGASAFTSTTVPNIPVGIVETTNLSTANFSSFPANAGIAIGSATVGRVLGVFQSGGLTPDLSVPAMTSSSSGAIGFDSATSPPMPIAAGSSLAGRFGLLTQSAVNGLLTMAFQSPLVLPGSTQPSPTTVTQVLSTPVATLFQIYGITGAGIPITVLNPAAPLLVAGTNTLQLVAQGNVYSIYLNGGLWGTSTTSIMTDRAQPGLLSSATTFLSLITANNLTPYGITSFKAWPVGQAEPLDQSGHGTYASGYIDRYHSTGSYNPLA